MVFHPYYSPPSSLQSACLVLFEGTGKRLVTWSPEQPPLHQGPCWQNLYLVRDPGLETMLDCPLKHTKSASTCKKKTYKKLWWMAKWSHLCIKWLLEKDWDTIRVSSLSSLQTNDVQSSFLWKLGPASKRLVSEILPYQANLHQEMGGGKCVICETDARLSCWNLGLLQNLMLKGTGPVHDKPSPRPPHRLWLVRISFLTFLQMSELPVHLYWLANKLHVSVYQGRWKSIKLPPSSPPTSTPAH